jgi:hypothetical protein
MWKHQGTKFSQNFVLTNKTWLETLRETIARICVGLNSLSDSYQSGALEQI